MEDARSKRDIVVSQQKNILNLLKEIGIFGCKSVNTPLANNYKKYIYI